MKILLVAPLPPPYGGIANWTLLMQSKLQNNTEVDLVGVVNTGTGKRDLDGRTLWDRVVVQGLGISKQWKEVKKLIRKEKPDAVHLTTSGSLGVFRDLYLLCKLKKEKIHTVYHIHFGRIPEISERNTWEWKLIKKAVSISGFTVAIDGKTYNSLLKYFSDDKIKEIPNPFDLSAVQSYGYLGKKEIIFIGWVVKTKGIEELLSSWSNLFPRYPDWTLRIVGPYNEGYKAELESKFNTENVIFDGEKDHSDAMELLKNASVFTLPSYTEGFPNSVLEAMAYGKAIVAADVGAISEMLEPFCGLIVNSQNAQELELALEKMIADEELRKQCGNNARQKLECEYSVDTVFQKYKKVWNS